MVTKEQALKDIDRVYDPNGDPEERWEAYDRVRSFIQQSPRVPEKISDYGYPDYGDVWGYYMEGWNDCIDEMTATVPKPGADND